MWWWRKVRLATIDTKLRDQFELFGEDVLAHALAIGAISTEQGPLVPLLKEHRSEMMAWLQERRDIAERHADRLETVEWAILIFVVLGVIVESARAFPEKAESGGIPIWTRIGFKIRAGQEARMGWGSRIRRICGHP